jgi:hypothetical protein
MTLYRIKSWDTHYENNRTRDIVDLKWIPIPIKLSGDGYTYLVDRADGPAVFGAFIATAELAGTCSPRGTLIRSNGQPHTAESISRITRMPKSLVTKMLEICTSEEVQWLEMIITQEGAAKPQEGAGIPQEGAQNGIELNGIELNGMEEKEDTATVKPSHPDITCRRNGKLVKGIKFHDHVVLTVTEHTAMLSEWGAEFTAKVIEQYDRKFPNSKAVRGHTDHNRAIRDYVDRGFIGQSVRKNPGASSVPVKEKFANELSAENSAWVLHRQKCQSWDGFRCADRDGFPCVQCDCLTFGKKNTAEVAV